MGRLRYITIGVLVLASCLSAQPHKGGVPPLRPGKNPVGVEKLNKLSKMSPAQRQKMMDRLPPDRRKQLESRLDNYNQLSPQEKQRLHEQVERFQGLPPEKQEAVRNQFRKFNSLPEDRRPLVRQELQRLRAMAPEQRQARMNSDEFRNGYNRNEQQILDDLTKLMPAPQPSSPGPR